MCLNVKLPSVAVAVFALVLWTSAEGSSQERRKVGLVLGGGGALGMSHIGVLKVLEEERVPIDYICGTSMGAIIGGLYASGMSPDEIQAFLQGLDWDNVMSDETPRRELYFRRKLENQRYLFKMGLGKEGIKLGTGLAAGQKFNNLLQYEVQRSASITNYNELPIPYRAVATDLLAGKPYVMDGGNLARSMRASMAVPGAFSAVEIDGRVLVDGGIVDNLPVDVAKEMGADIVIAVDVGAKNDKVDPEELEQMTGILSRTYTIMRRPPQLVQFRQADIGIQPQLDDMMASEFARVAEFVPRGVAAAQEHIEAIRGLAVDEETYAAYLAHQRVAAPSNITINAVGITGEDRVAEKAIRGRIHSKPGNDFDKDKLALDLMRVFGIGEFEQVLYRLEQDGEGSGGLTYEVTEDPVGPLYMAVGLNLQSDFEQDTEWNILLNLTRRSINALGAEWRNELVVGSTQAFLSEFFQPLNYAGTFFIAPEISYRSEIQDLYDNKDHIAEYDVETCEAKVDFGIQLRRYAELRIGPVWGNGRANVEIGLAGLPSSDDDYVGPSFSLVVDQEDRTYFAREGYRLLLEGIFPDESYGGSVTYDKLYTELRKNLSFGNNTVYCDLKYGTSFGTDLPGYALFSLGGPGNFSGLSRYQFRGSELAVGSLGYRYRVFGLPSQVGKGVYACTRGDAGNVWDEQINSDLRYGATIGLGVDFNAGPMALTYGFADGGYQIVYFSFGSDF